MADQCDLVSTCLGREAVEEVFRRGDDGRPRASAADRAVVFRSGNLAASGAARFHFSEVDKRHGSLLRGTTAPNRTMCQEHFGYMGIVRPAWSFKNETSARSECRSPALRERRVGKPQRRLTFSKHWRVGLAFSLTEPEWHTRYRAELRPPQ